MMMKIKEWIVKHKNLSLLVLLILAVTATYFLEERSSRKSEAALNKKLSVVDVETLGDIQSIDGIKLSFEKRGAHFYGKDNNLRLSEARLAEFFEILSGLKIKTFLDQQEVNKVGKQFYIPDPSMKMTFRFEKGEITFILGKKLDYDQSFYMEIIRDQKSQIVIVNDESPDPGVYQNDEEYKKSDAKYKRLEMVFLLTNKYFHDTRVFKDMDYAQDKINFQAISISTFRNKKFTLNFKTSSTIPSVPRGLNYFEENWISFHTFLTKLEGKSLYFPAEPVLLKEPLSRFEVVDRSERKYTMDVYKKYGEENGYFLKTSLDNIVYQLKPEDARYFFVNVQDFWEKRIAPSSREYRLKLTFFNGKTQEVLVSDQQIFKVKTIDGKNNEKLRPVEFKKLIEFLKMEGDHVSELSEKPTEILRNNIMQVRFENKTLNVILEDNDAILVDPDLKIKIHHYVGASLPFSIKYEDYVSP